MTSSLRTHQPQPQGEDFIPLAGGFDLLHQPANGLDALLVGLRWLDDAGVFGVHTPSVAQPSSGIAMAKANQ